MAEKTIKVLHVLGKLQRGGAEMRTVELMRHLDRDRFDLRFCSLAGEPAPLDDEVRRLGGEVYSCKLSWSFPGRFRRLLRRHRFDVVHSHVHFFSGYILRLAAREAIPQRVAHFRNTHDGQADNLRRRIQRGVMRRWIDRHATHVLGVSRGVLAAAWSAGWESDPRAAVLYNGLDPRQHAGPYEREAVREEFGFPGDARICIHVGRFCRQKNQSRALSIFARMSAVDPRLVMLFVGHGATDRGLGSRIAEAKLQERVRIAGQRNDVPRLLGAADLLLFPSRWEGLPGVVLEACAAGLPVLASDLPGVGEIGAAFDNVLAMPLSATDGDWSAQGMAHMSARGTEEARRATRDAFATGPFLIDRAVAAYSALWGTGPAAGGKG